MLWALLLAEGANPEGGAGWFALMPLILMAVAFYLIVMMPMRRQEKQRQAMIAAVKKNDRVVTAGGVIGVVVNVKEGDEEITLRVDDNKDVKIRVLRGSISRVLTADGESKTTS
ncbi:MAG: preprotein translocase subunit YajC [Gemmataceae bacterium]